MANKKFNKFGVFGGAIHGKSPSVPSLRPLDAKNNKYKRKLELVESSSKYLSASQLKWLGIIKEQFIIQSGCLTLSYSKVLDDLVYFVKHSTPKNTSTLQIDHQKLRDLVFKK